MTENEVSKRDQVQILRGLAVLLVVFFHFTPYLPGGFVGVDIFFVISGFVLSNQFKKINTQAKTISEARKALKPFWRARFFRLFPAYVCVTLFSLVGLTFLADIRTIDIALKQFIATTLGFGNFSSYSLSGNYFNPEPNTLLHLWSLSAEIQIYLTVCLIAILCSRFSISFRYVLFGFAILCLILDLSPLDERIYRFLGVNNPVAFEYYSPISHSWQFILGILVANTRSINNSLRISSPSSFLFYISIILFFVLASVHLSQIYLAFCTILTGALLLLNFRLRKNFLMKLLLWLGDRSYSIYLIHLPLFYLVQFLLITFGIDNDQVHTLTALLLLISLSQYSFVLVEQRFRSRSNDETKIVRNRFLLFISLIAFSTLMFLGNFSQNQASESHLGRVGTTSECARKATDLLVCGEENSLRKVLVIGDSHAGALGEAVFSVFGKQGFQVHISSIQSCPFTLTKSDSNDESCLSRNSTIEGNLKRNDYDVIFSTFRNPYFSDWTPGSFRPLQYSDRNLLSGIQFLNDTTARHFLYLPNSELTAKTRLRSLLNQDLRVRSTFSYSFLSDIDSMSNFSIVATDSALCSSETCTYAELSQILGYDGNHLNMHGVERLVSFLARRGAQY